MSGGLAWGDRNGEGALGFDGARSAWAESCAYRPGENQSCGAGQGGAALAHCRRHHGAASGRESGNLGQFIKYPRSRIEKLGIKPGQRVLLVGLEDEALDADLASRDCTVLRRETKAPVDVAMVLVDTPDKLRLIARYRQAITPDASLWVIRPKGKDTPVTEAQVRDAAKRAELVDIKVVSFSDTHSAEKLVIPRARRGA